MIQHCFMMDFADCICSLPSPQHGQPSELPFTAGLENPPAPVLASCSLSAVWSASLNMDLLEEHPTEHLRSINR